MRRYRRGQLATERGGAEGIERGIDLYFASGQAKQPRQSRRYGDLSSDQRFDDLVELRGVRGFGQHPRLVETLLGQLAKDVPRGRAVRIPDVTERLGVTANGGPDLLIGDELRRQTIG